MIGIDDILAIGSAEEFDQAAMEVFRYQAVNCAPYREYMQLAGIDPAHVLSVGDIPFLPIELFKTRDIYCGPYAPEKIFTSSSTGSGIPSRHMMARLSDYEKIFERAFSLFYGNAAGVTIFALLPGYLEREGSSLIYMVGRLIALGGGGFYLRDTDRLLRDIRKRPGKKILLGVTYALLDLAAEKPDLSDIIIMETGGMKGTRAELPKQELHKLLCDAFGVDTIHSEYGMAELTSQAYSTGGGVFRTPPWMRVTVRDVNDPFDIYRSPATGGINITDLANLFSCAFIQTQDIGTAYPDGSFTIGGRVDHSEIRGCNLLIQ